MKPSEILRGAARRVERDSKILGMCGCPAIALELGAFSDWFNNEWEPPPHVMRYFRMVAPSRAKFYEPWWDSFSEDGYHARIIGLCLAAAIAESEGQ